MAPLTCLLTIALGTIALLSWSARTVVPGDLVAINWLVMAGLVTLAFVVGNRVVATRYPDRPVPVLLIAAMAMALPLATTVPLLIEALMGLEGLRPGFVLQRVVPSRLPAPAFYLLVVYVVGLRQWYATARASALAQLVQVRAANLMASGALTAVLAGAVDDVRSMSSGSRAVADEMLAHAMQSGDPGASSDAARAVRDAARTSVRNSSHQLWDGSRPVRDAIAWRDILAVSLRAHPLPLAAAMLFGAYGCLVGADRFGGVSPPGAVMTALIAVTSLAVVFLVGRAVIRRHPPLAALVTVAAPLLVVMGLFRIPGVADPAISNVTQGVGAVSITLILLVLVVGSSVLLTARDSAGSVVSGLQEARREAEVDRRVLAEATARLQREVAQHVHGTVQPGLIAASLSIDEAVKSGDRAALHLALEDARRALDADFAPSTATTGASMTEVLDNLRARWAGLLDVQCPDPVPPLGPATVDAAREVVKECLNNAYIHGGARHAQVDIAMGHDGDAVVVVTDDGSGPGGGAPGLGSAIMAQVTRGDWTLAPADGGGAVVRAVLRGAP